MKRIISYPQAIKEALEQEMASDSSVIVIGQGVDDPKGTLGTTKDLAKIFGKSRVFDTPVAEDGMTGVAIGAALCGLRPVHIHIRMDFLLLAMNQIVNMAAKMRYMYGGKISAPLVIRVLIGKSWGQGPQHSQSLYPLLMNIPGLKIVAPATPYDAKGSLIAAIRDNNPVIFIEHRLLYYQKGFVPRGSYISRIGKARILLGGDDITLVGVSQASIECLRAAKLLRMTGIKAEVIDALSLSPLDIKAIEKSVLKTKRLVVVDNAWGTCAAGAEILARITENNIVNDFKFRRLGFQAVPCPTTPSLEKEFYPDAKKIASCAYKLIKPAANKWNPSGRIEIEEVEFKGPF